MTMRTLRRNSRQIATEVLVPAPATEPELEKGHVCTCGDCEVDAYVDSCKYEIAAREALEQLKLGSLGGHREARLALEAVLDAS